MPGSLPATIRRLAKFESYKPNPIDRKVLRALQEDCDISYNELARQIGVNNWTTHRTWLFMDRAKLIRGYYIDIDLPKLGYDLIFYAIIGVDNQKERTLTTFEKYILTWPFVQECHMINGKGGDFLLKLIARKHSDEKWLIQLLTRIPTVNRVQTFPTVRTCIMRRGLPF